MSHRDRAVAASLLVGLLLPGCLCNKEDETAVTVTPPGVTRCLNGLQKAGASQTLVEATSIYYDECADLFSQATCRDAWHVAAKSTDVDGRLGMVAGPCRKAYCPSFSAFGFGICKDDFVETPRALIHEWPPL